MKERLVVEEDNGGAYGGISSLSHRCGSIVVGDDEDAGGDDRCSAK